MCLGPYSRHMRRPADRSALTRMPRHAILPYEVFNNCFALTASAVTDLAAVFALMGTRQLQQSQKQRREQTEGRRRWLLASRITGPVLVFPAQCSRSVQVRARRAVKSHHKPYKPQAATSLRSVPAWRWRYIEPVVVGKRNSCHVFRWLCPTPHPSVVCVELLGSSRQPMTGRLATHPSNTTVKI